MFGLWSCRGDGNGSTGEKAVRKPFELFRVLSPFTESVTIVTANAATAQDKAEHEKTVDYYRTKIAGFYDGTALGEVSAERDALRVLLRKALGAIEDAHEYVPAAISTDEEIGAILPELREAVGEKVFKE